jgi:hypothetical protein
MCRQFDSGPRHGASVLAKFKKLNPRKPPSNTVKPLLYATPEKESGGWEVRHSYLRRCRPASWTLACVGIRAHQTQPAKHSMRSLTPGAGRARCSSNRYQGFRRFRGLDLRFYVLDWFERTMFSRIRRQPLATQFFRACGGLMLAQKLRGRSQAEAQLRRRREECLYRSADPAG